MKTRPATASKWRGRFLLGRINGLSDAPRPGKPATYDRESERRILAHPGASWRNWINRRPKAMRVGMESCWPPRSKTSPTTGFGGSCASTGFRSNDATAGASQLILVLLRKAPMWSGFI
jgi:hypothetical protein